MSAEDLILKIRPPQSAQEYEQLLMAARADGHTVIAPTDLVWRGEAVVGYGSLGGAPLVNVWLARERVRARESVLLLQYAEGVLYRQGARQVIMPCWDGSPFAPYMEKLGYQKLGVTTLYWKGL